MYVTQTSKQMLLVVFYSFAWCVGNLQSYFGGSSTQQQEQANIFESVIVKPQNTDLGAWSLVPEAALISNQKEPNRHALNSLDSPPSLVTISSAIHKTVWFKTVTTGWVVLLCK